MKKIHKLILLCVLLLSVLLRLWKLNALPVSLYWEEAAIAYDAYSVLKTGKDHHGNTLPIMAFESFGDWKPSLYFYSSIPFIASLGLSELAIRLPAALSGVLIVLLMYLLAKKVFAKKHGESLALLASFFTAISPWAIQFSRAAWEVNLATMLILAGVLSFFHFLDKKKAKALYFIASVFLLLLSMYAYHAARLIAPFLGLGLMLLWLQKDGFREVIEKRAMLIVLALCMSIFMLLPFLYAAKSGTLSTRFAQTSIFSELKPIEIVNQRRDFLNNSLLSRLFYHRYWSFGKIIAENYASYFTVDFLFLSGDINPRHSLHFFGNFYYSDILLLAFGFCYLVSKIQSNDKNKYYWIFIIYWLTIGILPAAISKTNPHALRILPTLPVWILLLTAGAGELLSFLEQYRKRLSVKRLTLNAFKASIFIIITGISSVQLFYFWRYYSKIYPQLWASEWQYGYKQAYESLAVYELEYSDLPVYVTREQGRPAMYYWFFNKTNPELVQAADELAVKDQSEFVEFENKYFIDRQDQISGSGLLMSSPDFARGITREKELLYDSPTWQIYKLNHE